MSEPRLIGELLEEILKELRENNKQLIELTERVSNIEMMEEGSSPEEVLSCTEAAALLGRSRQWISNMLRCGKLHKIVRGPRTGILLTELKGIKK